METIYVYLKNEGTDCWRPVEAVHENKYYRIISKQDKDDEDWEFESGSIVECGWKVFKDGKKCWLQ